MYRGDNDPPKSCRPSLHRFALSCHNIILEYHAHPCSRPFIPWTHSRSMGEAKADWISNIFWKYDRHLTHDSDDLSWCLQRYKMVYRRLDGWNQRWRLAWLLLSSNAIIAPRSLMLVLRSIDQYFNSQILFWVVRPSVGVRSLRKISTSNNGTSWSMKMHPTIGPPDGITVEFWIHPPVYKVCEKCHGFRRMIYKSNSQRCSSSWRWQ